MQLRAGSRFMMYPVYCPKDELNVKPKKYPSVLLTKVPPNIISLIEAKFVNSLTKI